MKRMKTFMFLLMITVFENAGSVNSLIEEPHDYTISFFQFDPAELGVEKKESKKDIKPSDIYSNKNASHTNKSNTHLNKSLLHDIHNKNVTLNNVNSTKIKSKKPNIKLVTELAKNISKLHPDKKNVNTTRHKIAALSNFESFFENHHNFYRSDVLNPNPRPSVELALHNLHLPKSIVGKKPNAAHAYDHSSLENAHLSVIKTNPNIIVKHENTSYVLEDLPSKQEGPMKQIDTALYKNTMSNHSKNIDNLSLLNTTFYNVTNKHFKEKNVLKKHNSSDSNLKNVTNVVNKKAQLSKLEKDKKVNKEILEAAKKIVPIKNTVKPSPNIKNSSFSQAAELQRRNVTTQNIAAVDNALNQGLTIKNENLKSENHIVSEYSQVKTNQKNINFHKKQPVEEIDGFRSTISKHRENVAKFIPLYKNISKKDRTMGFQRGLLKHPEHKMFPKCHKCQQNSTYAQCVKSSTLLDCNNGLNNICFTRSTKKYGIISYEMGCADHKQCNDARAFPCKDGSNACFTCCQFDRCNSSPHHGEFELDSLNMDELVSLDASEAKSTATLYTFHWTWVLGGTFLSLKFLFV